jgi:hypothetical protein
MVNGVWIEFPEPKLIIRREGDKLTALLCSNDPPEVLHPSYQSNRYYFELTFDNDGDNIVADIRGQFIYFPKGNIVGQWTPVMATISAKPDIK